MNATPHALIKTAGRMRDFVRHAMVWQEPYREYGLVCWLFAGGAIWLALEVATRAQAPAVAMWGGYLLLLLVAVCAIDARFGIIPDALVVWLALGGLLQLVGQDFETIVQRVAAGVLAGLGGVLLRLVYRVWRGEEGLGLGDVKFLFAGAPWIGLDGLPALLLLAVFSAALSLLVLRLRGAQLSRSDAISFGPHLAVALWLVWVVGPPQGLGELFL